jgi:transposase InsO family protein
MKEPDMGRIDRNGGCDKTLERRHIKQMLRHVEAYELVKAGMHKEHRNARDFYESNGLCRQNFLKYYRRYLEYNRNEEGLLPHRTGRKFKDLLKHEEEVSESIIRLREKAYNRHDIRYLLKKRLDIDISASTIYRLMVKFGLNKLNPRIKEETRRIIKMSAGELGHIDVHYVTKGTVKEYGGKIYIVGVIDSYSRICWLKPIKSIKSIDVSYATMEMLLLLRNRYGIEFKEILSDNGAEFSSRNNISGHPFERMLDFLEIKHRYTRPCTPKTNRKIERFWKTLEGELLDGETFKTFEEFEHYLRGYCVYYNEHRMHQGIDLKRPLEMLDQNVVNI